MAGGAVAELRDVGLANHDRAGPAQALDHDIVLIGHEVAIDDRAGCGADAAGQDEVLDAQGDAGERADLLPRRDARLQLARLAPRQLRRRRAERVQRRFEALHPVEDGIDHLDRREPASPDVRGQRHRVHAADLR